MLKKTIMTELLTCDKFRANITLACTQYIPVYHARIVSDCAIDFIAISCEIIERRSSRAVGGMIIDDYSSLLIDLWIDLSVGVEQNKKFARAKRAPVPLQLAGPTFLGVRRACNNLPAHFSMYSSKYYYITFVGGERTHLHGRSGRTG